MANEWNVSYPINHTLISALPSEIRKLKTSVKTQIGHEHETPVDGDETGSEHSNGSAVCYIGTDEPTLRPDGVTGLGDNDIDNSRLWLDTNFDPPVLKRWNADAWEVIGWTPGVYAGEESITFPNGLIFKHGYVASVSAEQAISFAVPFPGGIISVSATSVKSGQSHYNTKSVKNGTVSVNGFTVAEPDGSNTVGFYWQAWGY